MNKLLIIVLSLLSLATNKSCDKDNTKTFWVNGVKSPCDMGAGLGECMQIYDGEDLSQAEWKTFYDHIEGFEYKPGIAQRIKVKVESLDPENVPADGSSLKYTLIEVLETQELPKDILTGEWQLTEMYGNALPETAHKPTLAFSDGEKKVTGNDGCNNYFGTFENNFDEKLTFGPLAGTRKMCPDMTVSKSFNQAMTEVRRFTLTNGVLSLMNEEGLTILVFSPKETEPMTQLHDIWVATSIGGQDLDKQADLPRLEIYLKEQRISGNDGCNEFNGPITKATADQLEFGPIIATLKMCQDMTIPDQFHQALSKTASYQIENLHLTLFDKEGNDLIRLRKVD